MVENAVAEKDRDEIGTSKEENQFNFGAGKRQEVDPRWKHPKPFQYEEDGMVVTRTSVWSAPGCHEGCGVLVYSDKETGKFIKCEGDPDDPYNRGALCPRCLAFKQVEFHPDRILHPMKRAGERGSGQWERITWDEALETCYKEFRRISMTYGGDSIHCLRGTARDNQWQVGRMANTFGSPNEYGFLSGTACYLPRLSLMIMTYGGMLIADFSQFSALRYDDPEWVCPECTIVWGCNPTISNPDFFMGHWVTDAMKLGCKLISVEPRVTWLAAHADIHLQLRPGTDTGLALGMIKVIIDEDLYDHDFVDKWCYGFDQLAERVQDMPVEKAAGICGIDADLIREAARVYATSKPAQIAWGLAIDQKSNGVQAGHCVLALEAITGNIDVPGGQLIGDVNDGLELGFGWNNLGPELQGKIMGIKEYPAYVGLVLNAQCDMVLDALETGEPYAFKMGGFEDTNFLAGTCAAQPKRWHDAMVKNLEWCFGIDVWMTPTIQACCELFLPLSTTVEHDTVVYTHYGASPIMAGAVNKSITVGEGKGDCEIMYEIGRRCMPENYERFEDYYDFLEYYRLNNKQTFVELREEVVHQKVETLSYRKYESGKLRPDGKPGFNTPTGRVELYSTMFRQFGEDPLPYYEEPQLSPVSTPELAEQFPLVLTTGARTYCYFHSEGKQIPYLREMNPDPLIEINPDDALRFGVADGQWVEVENPFGKCVLKAKVSQIVKPGVVHAQHGFWFPEKDGEEPSLYEVWRSNINELVPHKYIGKLGFGSPFKCLLCSVKPAERNYDTDLQEVWDRFGKLVK